MSYQEDIIESPRGRNQDWDSEYDCPSKKKHCDQRKMYRRGLDADLTGEHQPCNIQTDDGVMPGTLFISGIHQKSTEDEIIGNLQYYGNLNSFHTQRNQFNGIYAFVEFSSQREANSAINNLNGKPPLFWSVGFVDIRGENSFNHSSEPEVIVPKLERETPLRLLPTVAVMKRTASLIHPGKVFRESPYEFPPCTVCAIPTKLVCFVCKTPYCSDFCESVDWPTHRNRCIPPPALEYAPPLKCPPIKGTPDCPNLYLTQTDCKLNADSLVNPHPSIIQGIRTMGFDDGPSLAPQDDQPIAFDQEPARVFTDAGDVPSVPQAARTPMPIVRAGALSIVTQLQFKPKFGPLESESNPPKYATVLITEPNLPTSFYVQIKDVDTPRYDQMHSELQVEFQSASRQSASYCRSPILGNPYALHFEGRWCRVQIERKKGEPREVLEFFDVDTGFRTAIQTGMDFHKLPQRFVELPAQAIPCVLAHVCPPRNSDFSKGMKFPKETFKFTNRYRLTHAVAFFLKWELGQVGRTTEKSGELKAYTILYPMDGTESINMAFDVVFEQKKLARVLTNKIKKEDKKYNEIRLEMIKAHGSK